jgi:hypothetical protein
MTQSVVSTLRIESDGTSAGTRVIGPDGSLIGLVQRIEIVVGNNDLCDAIIHFKKIPFQFKGPVTLVEGVDNP